MKPRSIWNGQLKVGELACPVSLYSAATTSERVSFHLLNRKTGHRLQRQYVDEESGNPVDKEEQVKGYETAKGQYVSLTQEEVADAVPDSDKVLSVEAFVGCSDVDTVFFDKPYYLAPGEGGEEAFAVIREGMRARGVAAVAHAVLFRRVRSLAIRPMGKGLVANTLHFDYEVRPAATAFKSVPALKLSAEMLELARHIIDTKAGNFDPEKFEDRYDDALAELVRAKQEGREIKPPKPKADAKVIDLMEALRQSAGAGERANKKGKTTGRRSATAGKPAAKKRKAG